MTAALKIAPKLPVLIPRALAGDPTAIALLAVAGISAAHMAVQACKSARGK